MKKYLFASAAFCLAVSTSFSQAKLLETVTKKGDEIIIPYQKYVLPNGLPFYWQRITAIRWYM